MMRLKWYKIDMNAFEKVYGSLLRSSEELWDAGGAVSVDGNGVPDFDLEIIENKLVHEKAFRTHHRRTVGREAVRRLVTSDGIDRLVRVLDVDEPTGGEFVVTDGTAWTTTIDGYAGDRAKAIAAESRVPVIQVGSEHSSRRLGLADGLRLPKTILEARGISLAKTAQSEQLIIGQLMDQYDLPHRQYAIGDSRGSMKTPGQFAYAERYGSEIAHFDVKAPCVPEKLELKDMPRFARWLQVEALGGVAVIAELARQGELGTLVGTTSINPNFIASSLIGIMPALASGEAGSMVDWVPREAHGHVVVYEKDGMSLSEQWDERWQDHQDVYIHHVGNKSHAHLLQQRAHLAQRARIQRFGREFIRTGGDVDLMDWDGIYGHQSHDAVAA